MNVRARRRPRCRGSITGRILFSAGEERMKRAWRNFRNDSGGLPGQRLGSSHHS